ncbi:zinc finger MYM-type protein 1 [Acanthopagrus latus]|uniref:zinc finger MYM-type protein 1 n=1 Tax=Acanthopagrus latus TaxID=8177 RepID=UPI00187C8219|nr:zinc finger MYM-type protein 1 [Acanthopagrus latus]XP_036973762.1 zinc finger MYM-type protein 1 [Acanthopagrus latus]XP_036973770.1 zinc finger MYM-type protein 1 [Acanthopagrus latus]
MEITSLKKMSSLTFVEKKKIILTGRPTPDLENLTQRKGQKIVRTFQTEWYKKKEWLCGCSQASRLFCFPCLLFSVGSESVWVKEGYGDLNNLPRALLKHEKSTAHIHSQIALKTFGKSRIDTALDEQHRLHVTAHNEKVKANREILKSLIDATSFLAKQELAFRGNDEGNNSINRGNYVELLHLMAEKDDKLAKHLKESTVFVGTSNRIQNDLIEAISDVVRSSIKSDVDAASFVAVEVDETTDANNKAQISAVLRYVNSDCEVKEAFLGFDDVSNDRRAQGISKYVLDVLEKYECAEKLIAQTYDGAAVMASELNGVQAKVKEKVPEATFLHCYAHKLNLVLSQSAKSIPECKVFFKSAEGLSAFFTKSTKRTHLLDEIVKCRIPRASSVRWNSNSRLVQTILQHLPDLHQLFRTMMDNSDEWDGETIAMASGFDLWLSKASTYFLLMVYDGIFNVTDALFRVLQNKAMDIGVCCARVRDTMCALSNQRDQFDSLYDRFEQKKNELKLTDNSRRTQSPRDERRMIYTSVLDNITEQLKARFDNLNELAFLGLVDSKKFSEMSANFDTEKLNSLSKYARFFDQVRLQSDLVGLYCSQLVQGMSPAQLLSFLKDNDLQETVPEATKLLKLVLTIPATTASVERTFSALKRIKTYNRNRMHQDRLSALALISIEKERLMTLQNAANKDDFYNKVINKFVQRDRRMDFIYK